MKRIHIGKESHWLRDPKEFEDLIREEMGDESADLFAEIVHSVDNVRTDLDRALEYIEPEYEQLDLFDISTELASITNWN